VKFWTWKFIAALVVLAAFVADATCLGRDPYTSESRHLLPFADTGAASFVFLLVILYVFSHIGGWVYRKFRPGPAPEPSKQKKPRRR